MAKITQDAGREALGEFAPQFAHLMMMYYLERTGIMRILILVPGEETSNEWCEPVTDEEYSFLV